MSAAGFRVSRREEPGGRAVLSFQGELVFGQAAPLLRDARALLGGPGVLAFDLSGVERLDTATLALLLQLRCECEAGGPVALEGAQGRVAELVQRYGAAPRPCLREPPARISLFEHLGRATLEVLQGCKDVLEFMGEGLRSLWGALRAPRTVHWADLARLMERSGADAFPIVFLISFLIGLIMAFQSAVQLKQFGADIFVADLVGLVVVRELGPLMTAIVVAGRSGAGFAAELGTMKVSEEIDALRTLGQDPYRFLVFPRVLALAAMLPLLTLLADLVGLAGGLVTSLLVLDLTPRAYLEETRGALDLWDVFSGVLKSVFFAHAVGLIACQRGLATRGGAEGVGRATTSAVVSILFALVVLDAVFAVVFHVLGL